MFVRLIVAINYPVAEIVPRLAVVVGASSGIGAAAAEALAGAGYQVHLLARREGPLFDLAKRLGGTYETADVTDEHRLAQVEARLAETFDSVSVLVYTAGIMPVQEVDGHSSEDWHRTLNTNLTGAFFTVRAFLPLLRPGARVVFVSSTAGRKGLPHLAAYSASKGGLNMLAEALAAEFEPRGIGVHIVEPGPVATPMLNLPGTSPFQLDPEQVGEVIAWLAQLPSDVVLREVSLRAVTKGPFVRLRHTERGTDVAVHHSAEAKVP